jgi:chromodomain-helicase-DNA-binding protein 1
VNSSPMANGGKPLSDHERKLQHVLAPISDALARAHGAQRKKIPDDNTRLKIIKVSLVAIGDHIFKHPKVKDNPSLEDSLWDFVSEHHWPQSAKEANRVPGKKLKDMYIKIAGKDAAPKAALPKSASNGATKEVKKEPSPAEEKKLITAPPGPVKAEDKMDVDSKSPA